MLGRELTPAHPRTPVEWLGGKPPDYRSQEAVGVVDSLPSEQQVVVVVVVVVEAAQALLRFVPFPISIVFVAFVAVKIEHSVVVVGSTAVVAGKAIEKASVGSFGAAAAVGFAALKWV